MPSRPETTITLTNAPEDGERAVVMDGLRAYNEERAGVSGRLRSSPHTDASATLIVQRSGPILGSGF
jgi:hypothetical protein